MAANDSICSGNQNSTDCLLRALLQAIDEKGSEEDGSFNWDPLSFGFTAPVGILAAVFTFMTVIQMMVTSGPGRRRSDKQVIGRWSSKKKTYLSWSELRLLTIVPTPVLKIIPLRQTLHASLNAQETDLVGPIIPTPTTVHWTKRISSCFRSARRYMAIHSEKIGTLAILAKLKRSKRPAHSLPMAKSTQSSRAKWLVHLDELDLEGLIFEKGDSDQNAADYLPADLQAVPAYGEVGCTVALAAASGISSLKADGQQSPYPLIIGKGFQLNFRDHPLLGSIGVFSRHGRRDGGKFKPSKEEVLLALYHAEGEVEARAKWFVSSRQLYGNGHPFRPRCQCGGDPGGLICSSSQLLHEKNKNVLWLLAAETPRRVPAIFPSRSVKLRNVLTTFILQNQSWAYIGGSRLQDDIRSIFPSEFGRVRVWWADDMMTKLSHETPERGFSYFLTTDDTQREPSPHHPEYTFFLHPNTCGAITEVFQLCLRFLYDFEDFADFWQTLSERQAELNRIAILLQIQQLDKLLAMTDPNFLECRKTVVYLTAQAFLIVEEDVAGQALDADRLIQLGAVAESTGAFWEGPKTRFLRHCEPTLKTLDAITTPREDRNNSNSSNSDSSSKAATATAAGGFDRSEFARQESRLRTIIAPWYAPDLSFPCPAREALLQRLKRTVHVYKEVQGGIDGRQRETDKGPRTATFEEVVDDIIIWRVVLLGLLFLTAPDNSDILDSGLWRHVIPLL